MKINCEDICPDCNEWKGACTCGKENLSTEEIFGITYGDRSEEDY